jgi:hypothetical protein
MRGWLKTQYGDLSRLNEEWGSGFRSWDEVVPMTTSEAVKRTDQNFAAWSDFKEWMDVAFARALRSGADAVHAVDHEALSAIEGAQIPGWGGYDYSRLASSTDAMELDDVELMRSFNPDAVMLTTSHGAGATAAHRAWRELLRGTRGLILWDPDNQFADKDGAIGNRGREAAGYFRELRQGIGALLINSPRHDDPIGILYSPASMRIGWLLDRIRTGEDWSRRSAETELGDDRIRASVRDYARAIRHLGLQHRFLSTEQIEAGDLTHARCRVLILPWALSLSARAAEEIRNFVNQGGAVVADGEPGRFDEHGRRLASPALGEIFSDPSGHIATRLAPGRGEAVFLPATMLRDRQGRERLRDIFAAVGVEPMAPLVRSDGRFAEDVETYIFENGAVAIVALLRDLDTSSGAPSGEPETLDLVLPRAYQVYDVRAKRGLGRTTRLTLKLGPVEPIVLALSEEPLPELSISGPPKVHAGDSAEFRIAPNGDPVAGRDVIHVEIADPDGSSAAHYGGNFVAAGGVISYRLPSAVNDKPGRWTLRATSVLRGASATWDLQVEH